MSEFDPRQLAQYDTLPSMAQGYSLARGISQDIRARNEESSMIAARESLIRDPSPKNVLAVTLRHPQLGEGIKAAFENMDIEERKRRVAMAIPIYSASLSGRGDIAKKLLLQQAAAMEASGGDPDEITRLKEKADMAVEDPATFQRDVGTALAYGMGEKNFASAFAAIEGARTDEKLLPYKQYESAAKAEKDTASATLDQAKAPFAREMAEAQLETEKLKPWDTRQDNITNKAQVDAALELNKIKQGELNLSMGQKKQEIEEKKIQKDAILAESQSVLNNTMDTIKEALSHPSLKDTPLYRASTQIVPGSNAREFGNILKSIDANSFITAMKQAKEAGLSFGQLSNAEGDNLRSLFGKLDISAGNEYNAKILAKIYNIVDSANKRQIATRVKMRAVEKTGSKSPATVKTPEMVPMPDDFYEIMK